MENRGKIFKIHIGLFIMVHPLISQFVTNQVDFIVTRLFDD